MPLDYELCLPPKVLFTLLLLLVNNIHISMIIKSSVALLKEVNNILRHLQSLAII